jgi:protein ImuB
MACIDIPDLPLQMLLREHPDWRDAPVGVVAEDKPEAPLLLINRHARALRLRTGMRYGAAKSLLPELRAGTVSALEVEQITAQLVRDLQTFSPHVERDPVHPGVFYVDPGGLSHLYGGELSWGRAVHRFLMGRHFYAALVVGFGRALSYALSRVTRGVRVINTLDLALSTACEVPLSRLYIEPKLRDALERLGMSTLGDLRGLGVDQLGVRFGAEAARLSRVAHGEEILPLCAEPHLDTPRVELEIDPPDDDVARLCFVLKRALDLLLENVRQRGQSVRAVWMRLNLLRSPPSAQRLEPSAPTRDAKLLLELLRLRLSTLRLPSPVVSVTLEAETSELAPGQISMFVPKRDLAAGARALSRLKASFGEDVVCSAELVDAHLPEAQFRWVAMSQLRRPQGSHERTERAVQAQPYVLPDLPTRSSARDAEPHSLLQPLVRRLLKTPEPLAGCAQRDPRTGKQSFVHAGECWDLTGPYRVSSGWWAKQAERDYYYARAASGALWWLFFDVQRASWFLHATLD